MPYYDMNEQDLTIFEPLVIKIDDIELTIQDRDRKEFDEISSIRDPHEQLARWADVDIKKVEHIKMKKVAAALKIIARDFLSPALGDFKPKKA